jgi:hypothetical protein
MGILPSAVEPHAAQVPVLAAVDAQADLSQIDGMLDDLGVPAHELCKEKGGGVYSMDQQKRWGQQGWQQPSLRPYAARWAGVHGYKTVPKSNTHLLQYATGTRVC